MREEKTLETCWCWYCSNVRYPFGYYHTKNKWRKNENPRFMQEYGMPFEFSLWLKKHYPKIYKREGEDGVQISTDYPDFEIYTHKRRGMPRIEWDNNNKKWNILQTTS